LSKNAALTNYIGHYQTPTLVLSGSGNNYSVAIELNAPQYLHSGISYADGKLTSNSTTITKSELFVETGKNNFQLTGTLNFTYIEETGISEIKDTSITIYPNPVKAILIVNNENLIINKVGIVNLSGKVIYQFNNSRNQVDVSALLKGIYFVKIETDKGIVTKKFVKE